MAPQFPIEICIINSRNGQVITVLYIMTSKIPYLHPSLRNLKSEQVGLSSHKNVYQNGVLEGNWLEERMAMENMYRYTEVMLLIMRFIYTFDSLVFVGFQKHMKNFAIQHKLLDIQYIDQN